MTVLHMLGLNLTFGDFITAQGGLCFLNMQKKRSAFTDELK